MSVLNNTWSRLAMAGLIVAGLTRESLAQDIPTLTPPDTDIIEETNTSTSTIDDIENNVLRYARTRVMMQKSADGATRQTFVLMQKNTMEALQRALIEFRAGPLESLNQLPEAQVTGDFDLKTARALIATAQEIRFYDIFMGPPLGKYDADTLVGLAIVREGLKRLAPQDYMDALEIIAGEIDQLRIMAEERAQLGMIMEFKQCALALQDEIPTAPQLSQEIKRVSTEPGYVSQYVSEGCYDYTKELNMTSLRAAQLDFLHESPVMTEDRNLWCYRDTIGFDGPTCLEYKL